MSDTAGALGFLVRRTIRNRVAKQLARIKTPRYAIAVLMGGAYLWLVLLRPGGSLNRLPMADTGPAPEIGLLAGIGVALTVILWWLKGGVGTALAFQPAEVQLLFTAPVTRRALIAYKVARSQILLLVNAVIWVLLMRRWGVALSVPMRFVTAWGFFSVLSLHRLGAALVQTQPQTGGRRVARVVGGTLAAAVAALLLAGVAPVIAQFGSLGASEGFRALGAALHEGPAGWALAPFRLVTAPLYATSAGEWLGDFAIVATIIAAHLLWVFGMDVAFEEAAATATVEYAGRIAALKERRAGGAAVLVKSKPGGLGTRLPLAPLGWPATALAWKNTLALLRTGSVRMVIVVVVVILASSKVWGATSRASAASAIPYLMVAAMTFVLGPRLVRNDLRQDLLHLSLLKSYPLRGASVVAAEMTSPTLVLTMFQMIMLLAAFLSVPAEVRAELRGGPMMPLLLVAPFAMLVLNAMNIGIQNGLALLFPSWVRLGADSGGIEAIGQNIVVMIGSLLALGVSLILPVAAAGVARVLSLSSIGAGPAAGLAAAVGTIVLVAEIAGLVAVLGHTFDRMDPTALG